MKPETGKVSQINARLKAALVPVSVLQRGKSLYLRSSKLPPKPGDKPGHRYEIPMGPASTELLITIESAAHELWRDVVAGRFDWRRYDRAIAKPAETVAEWMEKFEQHYVGEGYCAQTTFNRHWRAEVLDRLPQQSKVSAALFLAAVLRTPANSRLRRVTCQKLQKFATFAGVDVNLSQYQGSYGTKSAAPRDLPTDEQIEAWYLSIPWPAWQIIFARIAVFGLRPSEAFEFELIDPHTAKVVDAKSRLIRTTKAFHPHWAERWHLTGDLPRVNASDLPNRSKANQLSDRIRVQMYRAGVRCERYDLRHAWCVRVSVEYRIPTALAARWAGHSPELHDSLYLRWTRADQEERVYQEMALRPHADDDGRDRQG